MCAATQHLAVETQFGTEMVDRAAHAVDAALWCNPQIQTLTIGFAAEIQATVRHLFFQIRQGQRLLIRAVQYQALATDFHLPERLVAAGAQGQALEVEVVAAVSFTLQTIDLVDFEATIAALALAAAQAPGQIGEQAGLAITAKLHDFALDTGGVAIDQHEATLFLAGSEHQLTIFDLDLTLQASRWRWAFRLAGVDLAGGQEREKGDAGKQGAGDGHESLQIRAATIATARPWLKPFALTGPHEYGLIRPFISRRAASAMPNLAMRPSTLHLPQGHWATVLDCLCDHFPAIDRATWLQRMARGRVLDAAGAPIDATHPYRVGLKVRYFREVPNETPIPFDEQVLWQDEHLLVADKPHFLPVMPAGEYVEQTLLARLIKRTGNPDLVPIHRIDRLTAGLVLFSVNPASRGQYQALFRQRAVEKRYEAIAPALLQLQFPYLHRSRMVEGEPFFRMQEVAGEANSETQIEVLERRGELWRYGLSPVTGRKHQLRVHLAGLGAPIVGDDFYPHLLESRNQPDDYGKPLKLLARGLRFVDPVSGQVREFQSELQLQW